jgi:hypothetical protein
MKLEYTQCDGIPEPTCVYFLSSTTMTSESSKSHFHKHSQKKMTQIATVAHLQSYPGSRSRDLALWRFLL